VFVVHADSTLEEDPTAIACAVLPAAEEATGRGETQGIDGSEVSPPSTGSGGLLTQNHGGDGTVGFYAPVVGAALLFLAAISLTLRAKRETE
jgi:hypothetical protein